MIFDKSANTYHGDGYQKNKTIQAKFWFFLTRTVNIIFYIYNLIRSQKEVSENDFRMQNFEFSINSILTFDTIIAGLKR